MQFTAVAIEAINAGNGQINHIGALSCRGRGWRAVRWIGAGQQVDIGLKAIPCRFGNRHVAPVDGVESSAIEQRQVHTVTRC